MQFFAAVREDIDAMAVATVHGIVHRVHAVELRRNPANLHFVAVVKLAAPMLQQVGREG
jgi:hypothetical protein